MQRFKLRGATFTPDNGDPDDTFEPFPVTSLRALAPEPDETGRLATVALQVLDPKYLDLLKEGTTGCLRGHFRDMVVSETPEALAHDYGRLKVVFCHPDGNFKAFSAITIVLVPAKD